MKWLLACCFSLPYLLQAQEVLKENQTPRQHFYYDNSRTKVQAQGCYYTDLLNKVTTEEHGKWQYFDESGNLVEERNYYRGKLNGPVKVYYANGKPKQIGYFKKNLQDSIFKEWYENGNLKSEGTYHENRPVGIWTEYYLTGQSRERDEYIDSVTLVWDFWLPDSAHTQLIKEGNGEYMVFFTTGAQKERYSYRNGYKNGPFTEYSIYGYTLLNGKFDYGEADSTWNYYFYTGDLEKTVNYRKGKLHGDYASFYDDSIPRITGKYDNGMKTGNWVWYTNIKTKDMEGKFKDDQQDGRWEYYHPNGKTSYIAHYKEGLRTGTWNYYYEDGSKFKIGSYENDLKNGKWETWYEDGTLLMTGSYINGKEEGEWSNFWDTGKLKNKSTFKAGMLEGEWLSYYPSGKLKLTGMYKDGMKTGEWIDYFENGKPKDIGNYKVVKNKSKIEYGVLKDYTTLESVKDGKWTSFSQKDYKRTEEGEYKNGEKDGLWYAYWPGGKIPSVQNTFKAGKLEGKTTEYDRKGNVISECDYKDGLKHGKMKLFDKKGKVVKELDFEYGMQIVKTDSNTIQFTPN